MKKSQLDRAIESLDAKIAAIHAKANAEVSGLESAILSLKAQRATKRSKGPKAVVKDEKVSA